MRGWMLGALLWQSTALLACAEGGGAVDAATSVDHADARIEPASDASPPDAVSPDAPGPDAAPTCEQLPGYEPVEVSCDGVDNDCNGRIDDVADPPLWYADTDGDGYGNPASVAAGCQQPNGYVDNALDCNDDTASQAPDVLEVCDGIDNDCNTVVDDVAVPPTWYRDADGDGFGTIAVTTASCQPPAGYVGNASDCDDSTGWRRPGLPEYCDGLDNDCNGATGDVCPYGCKVRWRDNGVIYAFCTQGVDWNTASTACLQQGHRLARIDDQAENDWVRARANEELGGTQVYVGASDAAAEGAWRWTDGAVFWSGGPVGGLYSRWNPGEPNDAGGEDCAEMLPDGTWNDVPCSAGRAFACERY